MAARNRQDVAFFLWLAMFAFVMLDSLIAYFYRTATGQPGLRVNAGLLVAFIPALLASDARFLVPPAAYTFTLFIGFMCFLAGLLAVDEYRLDHFLLIISALGTFIIGYATTMYLTPARTSAWERTMSLIGVLYVIVCALAVSRLVPALFPLIDTTHFREDGQFVVRPEVTTDQNFQVFYLLLCLLPLVVRRSGTWTAVGLGAGLASFVVLAQLQSRSGALVFGFGFALACWLGIRRGKPGQKLLAMVGAALIIAVVAAVWAASAREMLQPLIERFTKDDLSTFQGRLWSAEYLFDNLLDPSEWLPQGNGQFERLSGGEPPHFNPTAFFLEGGLGGLVCWVVVHLVPAVVLGVLFLRRRLNVAGEMIMLIGLCTLITSLSLNVPFMKQVWLWAGAVLGVRMNHFLHASTHDGDGVQQAGSATPHPGFRNILQ